MIKTEGIPIWVTIFAIIICVLNILMGVGAIAGSSHEETREAMSMEDISQPDIIGWGALVLAFASVAGLAVFLKNSTAYVILFTASIIREVGNIAGELVKPETHNAVLIGAVIFLVLSILSLWVSVKAVRQQ